MLDLSQKRRLVELYFENHKSPITTKRKFESESKLAGKPVTVSCTCINRIIAKWRHDSSVLPSKPRGRPVSRIRSSEIDRLRRELEDSPRRSIRKLSLKLKIPKSSVWVILRKELKLFPYRITLKKAIQPEHKVQRMTFANQVSDLMEKNELNHRNIHFSDEANFYLSGKSLLSSTSLFV